MKDLTVTIPANSFSELAYPGNFVSMKSPTSGSILVKAFRRNQGQIDTDIEMQAGESWTATGDGFHYLHLYNETASAIQVTLKVGVGKFESNRVSGNIAQGANAGHQGLAAITASITGTATAFTTTIAANADRAGIILYTSTSNTGVIWSGGAANNGIPLAAGATLSLPTGAAISLMFDTHGDKLYSHEITD